MMDRERVWWIFDVLRHVGLAMALLGVMVYMSYPSSTNNFVDVAFSLCRRLR